ncbi:MAG TPA: antibiotic biosynthesis monooxygenase [Anaerolineales bacterium]|jgi:heme-degrading monooxygenase HmoA|nr:antibiotic biosynthesis monooxygenase [Anaerolineales bacterium]HQX17743.1 antibiotic biosynthesis monooxygenase [Anaerolineales bacterium]
MVTVGLYYDVILGKEKIFEEAVDKILELLSKTPEHVNSYLYHRVREPNSYAIISEWSSKDAFSSFVQSDVFRQVTNWGKAELLVRRPSHKVYGHERDMR